MVDTGGNNAAGDVEVTKVLRTFYRLVQARPDKSVFVTDPTFSITLTTYISDDRPQIMQYMARILTALTESANNSKLVATLPNFESNLAKAIEKPFPPKIIHSLLVVQSRLNAARVKPKLPSMGTSSPAAPSIIKTTGTKMLVYQLTDNEPTKQETLQERCIPIKGVVSVCFSGSGPNVRSIFRVQDSFNSRILERCIFNCGYKKLQRIVRLDEGATQTYELSRDEVFALTPEEQEAEKNELPQYLDDNLMVFDASQCVVPNNHVGNNSGSWFSGVKAYLPFW
uniref:Uncharacterized protein n=1 Tax=Panagrolaimus sp. JU765 TaxID=591449 RepID=A0AC34Q8U4_9BILA